MARRRVKEVINATGRLPIRERDVSLSVVADPANVRITRLELPSSADEEAFEMAEVFAEALQPRTASFDRWSLGCVRSVRGRSPVDIHPLRNFSDASDALFTIKVVAPDGRILASSDDVRPDERRAGEREALLQVRARPLVELPWTVEIAGDYQTFLVVNSRIPAAESWIETDPVASALVLPAALRVVLARLLADDGFRASEWGEAWADWAGSTAPAEMPSPDAPEDHYAWIEETIEAFARNHTLGTRLVGSLEAVETER